VHISIHYRLFTVIELVCYYILVHYLLVSIGPRCISKFIGED
jgi:hypothetical protein